MSRDRNRGRDAEASNEEAELEAAETMLSRLKKQHRMMERNRRQYYDETTVFLTKQRKMVGDLEKEKNRLEENLHFTAAPRNQVRDGKVRNVMSAILDRQAYYERQIENEKDKIRDIDSSITGLEKELREARRRVPSTRLLESERQVAKIANLALENRIQQATVRLNGILADNTNLRQDIENLLKARDKFVLQTRRMEKLLATTSKRKNDLMDQVTKAYTEREEAQTKMRTLKDRIDRDNLKYTNELKKIQRAIDHQANLKSFVSTISPGEEEDVYRRKDGEGLEEGSLEAMLDSYKQSVSHLEENSGETSVDALLTNYLQADNDNYTVFSFISDLNNEVFSVMAEVRALQQDIDEVQGIGSHCEKENGNMLGSLKTELSELRKDVRILEAEVKSADDALEDLKRATAELFHCVLCDLKSVQTVTGTTEVTSSNLAVFLSVTEQRVKELCHYRKLLQEEGFPPSRLLDAANDLGNESQTESSPSSAAKVKPSIPHIGHTNEEDTLGPTTHRDLLASLRTHLPESSEEEE